jgi:hypothetical protein
MESLVGRFGSKVQAVSMGLFFFLIGRGYAGSYPGIGGPDTARERFELGCTNRPLHLEGLWRLCRSLQRLIRLARAERAMRTLRAVFAERKPRDFRVYGEFLSGWKFAQGILVSPDGFEPSAL